MDAHAALDFIDTSFENASPLWYERRRRRRPDSSDLRSRARLAEPRRRAHPFPAQRQARGEAHARIHEPGQRLERAAGIRRRRAEDRGDLRRRPRRGRRCPPRACRATASSCRSRCAGPQLYVARMEPYRLSDLDRLLESIRETSARADHDRSARPSRAATSRSSGSAILQRALPRLRPRPGASVGSGQQLGRPGADPAAAEGRRGGEAIPGVSTASTCCRWPTRTAWLAADALQPARQGPQSQLGQAGRSRARAGERGAGTMARRR